MAADRTDLDDVLHSMRSLHADIRSILDAQARMEASLSALPGELSQFMSAARAPASDASGAADSAAEEKGGPSRRVSFTSGGGSDEEPDGGRVIARRSARRPTYAPAPTAQQSFAAMGHSSTPSVVGAMSTTSTKTSFASSSSKSAIEALLLSEGEEASEEEEDEDREDAAQEEGEGGDDSMSTGSPQRGDFRAPGRPTYVPRGYLLEAPADVASASRSSRLRGPLAHLVPVAPSSRVRLAFDLVGMVFLFYDSVSVPYMLAWTPDTAGPILAIAWVSWTFWVLDMHVSFVTGFQNGDRMEMRLWPVMCHYLRTWFVLDFLLLGCDLTGTLLEVNATIGGQGKGTMLLKMGRLVKVSRLIRIAAILRSNRIARLHETFFYATRKWASAEFTSFVMYILKCIAVILWVSHLLACVWYAITVMDIDDPELSWRTSSQLTGVPDDLMYQTGLYWALTTLLTYSSFVQPMNNFEDTLTQIVVVFGFLFGSSLLAMLSAKHINVEMLNQERTMKMRFLRRFLDQHKVDSLIAIKVENQVTSRMDTQRQVAYNDVLVLGMLSASLRTELLADVHGKRLLQNSFLRACSLLDEDLVLRICSSAVSHEAHKPGELVFKPGMEVMHAWSTIWGSVEYVNGVKGEHETSALTRGLFICEMALWVRWRTQGMLEATSPCELIIVSGQGFTDAVSVHPELAEVARHFGAVLCTIISVAKPAALDDLSIGVDHDVVVASLPAAPRYLMSRPLVEYRGRTWGSFRFTCHPDLEREVREGLAHLSREESGAVVRVVQVVVLSLRRSEKRTDRSVCVELMETKESGELAVTLMLPGTKIRGNESAESALQRLLHSRLAAVQHAVSMRRQEFVVERRGSDRFGVETKYIKRIYHAVLSQDKLQEAPGAVPLLQVVTSGEITCISPTVNQLGSRANRRTGLIGRMASERIGRMSEREAPDPTMPGEVSIGTEEIFGMQLYNQEEKVATSRLLLYAWMPPEDLTVLGQLGAEGRNCVKAWAKHLEPRAVEYAEAGEASPSRNQAEVQLSPVDLIYSAAI